MGLAALFLVLLPALAAGARGAGGPGLLATPAFLIVAKDNGEILRCVYNNPSKCEVFHKASSYVSYTVVHGEYLYAATRDEILRCKWYRENSCIVYQKYKKELYRTIGPLAVVGGYLYAGAAGHGTLLWRCELDRPHSCLTVYRFSDPITSIYEFDKYIYIASEYYLSYCSQGVNISCEQVQVNDRLPLYKKVLRSGNTVIVIDKIFNTDLKYYTPISKGSMVYKNTVVFDYTYKIAVFKRKFHMLLFSGIVMVSDGDNHTKFTELVRHEGAQSISFAYAVHHIRESYVEEGCSGCRDPSPWSVANYRAGHRAVMEASVVEGKLYSSVGALVDTRTADAGRSGRAAVFALGPDGQLLLCARHRSGLVHVSSLLAGSPAAGAGEMQVEDGVVKRIVACSEYYRPDVGLNTQVLDALHERGYVGADDIILESCDYTCDKD